MEINKNKLFLLWNKAASFKLLLLFIFSFSSATSLNAQNPGNIILEKVQSDGLINDNITCISQDSNDFMWFGTTEGLFKYDGNSYVSYRNFPGDPTSIINNAILFLYPEKNRLWVGSGTGLSCLENNGQTVRNFHCDEFLQVYAILPKDDHTFWVGTASGLFEFNKSNSTWKRNAALGKNVFIRSISDDKKGHLYITTQNGFYCYTENSGTIKYFQPDLTSFPKKEKSSPLTYGTSLLDKEGNLWMGTWNAGLVHFNTKTENIKVWSHQTDDVHFLPYKIVVGLLQDDSGKIWLANMEGGLNIFNPAKNSFSNYPVEWNSENKLSGVVTALFRDRSGTIWIGTGNGIFKYDPHRFFLSKQDVLINTAHGLIPTHTSPIAMLKDKEGLCWMGMYEGIFIFDKKTGINTNCNKLFGLSANLPVFNILQDTKGNIWVTAKNLLVKITKNAERNQAAFKVEKFSTPDITSAMLSLYVDKENRIWIGTHNNGIFRFDQDSKKFISCHYEKKGLQSKIHEIRTICELSKDSLLMGGEHTGLFLLHVNNGRFEQIPSDSYNEPGIDPSINVIYKKGKKIWVGTENNGLWCMNWHLKRTQTESLSDGLPSMDINAILSDGQDNLWLLTNSGIVEFQLPENKITVFDKNDGIESLDALNTMVTEPDGSISVGSHGCIYNFNPARILNNTRPPKVSITSLRVFDTNYTMHNGESIKLDYNQNYFSFEYVALNYTQSKLNRYAYKMEGLDKKWNDAGARRYISYANLDEGTYVFNVTACNNVGVWNKIPAKLTIVISPPFWHRWWFYLSCALITLIIIYSLYIYNLNQLKIRLQLRDKIARDLHDDIGSSLSGINIFSRIALQKVGSNKHGSRELLEKISERSEKTLDALSDIVWSINTRNDSIDNFLWKLREFLSEMLEPLDIKYELTVEKEIENLKLGMIARKELYLIGKEAICNAAKYAHCSSVQISLSRYKNTCTLTISDDGNGFDVNTVSTGNGIFNMKQRAKKINGTISIESKLGSGTLITVSFPIPRFR